MATYIVSGSTLGAAEITAETILDYLQNSKGLTDTILLHSPDFQAVCDATRLCIVCSTYGAGDYPDAFQNFVDGLKNKGNQLNRNLKLCLIGLGSSEYDTYCQAIVNLEQEFAKFGIHAVANPAKIDCCDSSTLPEDTALKYFTEVCTQFLA